MIFGMTDRMARIDPPLLTKTFREKSLPPMAAGGGTVTEGRSRGQRPEKKMEEPGAGPAPN